VILLCKGHATHGLPGKNALKWRFFEDYLLTDCGWEGRGSAGILSERINPADSAALKPAQKKPNVKLARSSQPGAHKKSGIHGIPLLDFPALCRRRDEKLNLAH
jgi:hypothetical protein